MLCVTNMLLHDIDIPQIYHDNSLQRDVLDYSEEDRTDVCLMIIWSAEKGICNVSEVGKSGYAA